jgi:hypothetical protein
MTINEGLAGSGFVEPVRAVDADQTQQILDDPAVRP